ncbi:hypothetical protein [Noviherbaspirillum massiliense]|uniref:hypothetical protein n=1 Tax=Noviherbaspirillum massiliense TaxID=1465823 RepID=UPI001FDEF3E3|nr:hypothetical protein [Noviherbaspirillum massiliense]
MAQEPRHLMEEADIGSGEKSPGQRDIEQAEQSLSKPPEEPPLDGSHLHQVIEEQKYADQRPTQEEQRPRRAGAGDGESNLPGRILQSGTHIARILAMKQPDETYEAQVFVRLTREPEVAETYIPAGTFGSESDAWAAAEQRARRAFAEHEF